MKALKKLHAGEGLWLVDAEVPRIKPDEVLIKIHKTAICGTDIHIYEWDETIRDKMPLPLITGHEYVGVIVEKGALVTGLEIGDRVSGEGHLTCGHCRPCRGGREHLCPHTEGIGVTIDGAFAEYLALPACNAFKLPDTISDEVASILDPFGNAAHTALSFDLVGEDVLITGAGPIGAMAAAICRFVGARHIVIVDINDHRLALAKNLTPNIVTVNPNNTTLRDVIATLKMTEGFDVGLEMSGNAQAFNQMLSVMVNGGKVALLGLLPNDASIHWSRDVIFKGLFIKGIYGREMYETWYKMSNLISSGLDISPIITHRLPAKDFQQGFDIMRTGRSGKVILEWA